LIVSPRLLSRLPAAIAEGIDLLVINRFGRAESLGRGLLGCFTAAMEAGVRVLTAVRVPYVEAWAAYHGGLPRTCRLRPRRS
jgi:hypothetical protein